MAQVKSGFVTLLGLPNAGKSSLLNKLVGEDIAIVTPKAQTTWQTMRGFVVREGLELVVIDTPGVQEGTKALNAALSRNAIKALTNAREGKEIVALVVDAKNILDALDEGKENHLDAIVKVLDREHFKLPFNIRMIPTIMKADLVTKPINRERVEAVVKTFAEKISSEAMIPHWLSSKKNEGINEWLSTVMSSLPLDQEGKLFNRDDLTDKNVRDIVSEYIREQCFMQLGEELPYSIAVEIEKFDESNPKMPKIEAVLHVERDSQKAIVVGKGGEKIKAIGSKAREKTEAFLQKQIFLGLRVKVSPHWAREEILVKRFGYEEA